MTEHGFETPNGLTVVLETGWNADQGCTYATVAHMTADGWRIIHLTKVGEDD
jgi:hypothetical protein